MGATQKLKSGKPEFNMKKEDLEKVMSILKEASLFRTITVLKEEIAQKGKGNSLSLSQEAVGVSKNGAPCFVCPQAGCGRTFSCRGNLNRHMKTHSSVKPYKCRFCSKSFARKDDLNAHTRSHAAADSVQCPFCSSKFKGLAGCRNHLRKKHGKEFKNLPEELRSKLTYQANSAQQAQDIKLQVADAILRLPNDEDARSCSFSDFKQNAPQQDTKKSSWFPTSDNLSMVYSNHPERQFSDEQNAGSIPAVGKVEQFGGESRRNLNYKRPEPAATTKKESPKIAESPGLNSVGRKRPLHWNAIGSSNKLSSPRSRSNSIQSRAPEPLGKFFHDDHQDWLLNTGAAFCTKKRVLRQIDHSDLKAPENHSSTTRHHHHHDTCSQRHQKSFGFKFPDPCTLPDCSVPRKFHDHQSGCSHPIVQHGDHIDVFVDGELHHQSDKNECEVHGILDLLPAGDQEFEQWLGHIPTSALYQ